MQSWNWGNQTSSILQYDIEWSAAILPFWPINMNMNDKSWIIMKEFVILWIADSVDVKQMILKAVRLCLQFNDKQLQRSLPEKTIQGWIFFRLLCKSLWIICYQYVINILKKLTYSVPFSMQAHQWIRILILTFKWHITKFRHQKIKRSDGMIFETREIPTALKAIPCDYHDQLHWPTW